MEKIKVAFFGTHKFAATILESLLNSENISVDLVVTQPDKPAGRKSELTEPPVKTLAKENGLIFEQPATLKNYELKPNIFDLGITVQYGLIIPEHVLTSPKHGMLNVHASLLPKYRGASPIQSALINGETETGVTIMKMDKGLDTGPILWQEKIIIQSEDTYETLSNELVKISAPTLLKAINLYVSGSLAAKAQDNSKATITKQFDRESGKIDWNNSSQEIYNLYRGLTPWPGIWTKWGDKRLKLLKIKPAQKEMNSGQVSVENNSIFIGCGANSVEILELQLEGKKALNSQVFLQGNNIQNAILS